MNIKLSGIVAASMLALVAVMPMGLAHDDSTVPSKNMVSGNVVGAADPRFQLIAGADSQDISLGNGLCDMEVVSGANDGSNERFVDGSDTGAANTIVPEGTWDDGGFGAVCHTTNMDGESYDTWGCNYGGVTATDGPTGLAVWVIAGCDWGYASGGSSFDPTPLPGVDAYQNCAVNDGILGNLGTPGDIAGDEAACAGDLVAYASTYDAGLLVTCLTAPALCPGPTGGSFTCQTGPGAGNTQNGQSFEDTNSGFGDGTSVVYPTPANGIGACNDIQGMASMFVYNSVIVDADMVAPDFTGASIATLVEVTSDEYV